VISTFQPSEASVQLTVTTTDELPIVVNSRRSRREGIIKLRTGRLPTDQEVVDHPELFSEVLEYESNGWVWRRKKQTDKYKLTTDE